VERGTYPSQGATGQGGITYDSRMAKPLDPDDWEPHELSDFPPEMRLTIKHLNRFDEALHHGRIPVGPWRSLSPDYQAEQAVITIHPDDAEFRSAVAAVMPEGSYRIVVEDLWSFAL
jgi:hypothetical protein